MTPVSRRLLLWMELQCTLKQWSQLHFTIYQLFIVGFCDVESFSVAIVYKKIEWFSDLLMINGYNYQVSLL